MLPSSVNGGREREGKSIKPSSIFDELVNDFKRSHQYSELDFVQKEFVYLIARQFIVENLYDLSYLDSSEMLREGMLMLGAATRLNLINEEETQELLQLSSVWRKAKPPQSIESTLKPAS
jgi:hypothetical protein